MIELILVLVLMPIYLLCGVWLGYKMGRREDLKFKEDVDYPDPIIMEPNASTVGYGDEDEEEDERSAS